MKRRTICLAALVGILGLADAQAAGQEPPASQPAREALKADRRAFQEQELITGQRFTWIFNPGAAPRIVWRDAQRVQQLGGETALRVRWFDRDLNERAVPDHPGRWTAYVESRAPNGTVVRRSLTFYARPEGFLFYPAPRVDPPPFVPGPISQESWQAHQEELAELTRNAIFREINDSPAAEILLAGLGQPDGPPNPPVSAQALHEAHHLAVKLKVLNRPVAPLPAPGQETTPATTLRIGTPEAAGVAPGAKEAIDALCRQWAQETREPFVTLVARRGVIVTHAAFGADPATGEPITIDYRADVASITKTITAMVFARFLQEQRVALDEPVSVAFPDYPSRSPHVPTFRQCLTHMSGLSGHGDFDGSRNPHFENVILNGIDVNEPGKAYIYTGAGFDLTAKAMEMLSGTPWRRLYREQLFRPLGIADIPLHHASAGAQCRASDLAALGQLLLNKGSYGAHRLFSEEVYRQMLPERLSDRYPGITEVEGIGMHYMATPPDTLSASTLGHGALSGTTFLLDPEKELVIIQVRRQHGPKHGEYFPRFLQTIVENLR